MEGGMSFAELYGIEEIPTVRESIPAVLAKFEDVFDCQEELPQREALSTIYTLRKEHIQ